MLLSQVAKKKHEAIVKLLFERGAQIENINNYRRTPLLWAAANGYKIVVKLLFEKNAQIESTNNYR